MGGKLCADIFHLNQLAIERYSLWGHLKLLYVGLQRDVRYFRLKKEITLLLNNSVIDQLNMKPRALLVTKITT